MGLMLLVSGTLAEHHRRCDELFGAARAAASADEWQLLSERMNALREALLAHFRYEEERVFPLYEETSRLEGATEWLCAQHDDMRAALWVLATLSPKDERERYHAELAMLQTMFDAHAADEEARMYPLFERLLGR
jgi:DUF438 domain-containing protein